MCENAESLRVLNQKVKDRELEKLYLCVTVGIPKEKSARLMAYHQKDEATKTVRVSDKKFEGSRTMITSYRVLAETRLMILHFSKLTLSQAGRIR